MSLGFRRRPVRLPSQVSRFKGVRCTVFGDRSLRTGDNSGDGFGPMFMGSDRVRCSSCVTTREIVPCRRCDRRRRNGRFACVRASAECSGSLVNPPNLLKHRRLRGWGQRRLLRKSSARGDSSSCRRIPRAVIHVPRFSEPLGPPSRAAHNTSLENDRSGHAGDRHQAPSA
jgi:hypothetical protein